MRGKLQFIAGGLIGYVLGARAGRQRYEQIAAAAKDFWEAPPVQRRVYQVRDAALEALGDTPVMLFRALRRLVRAATGRPAPSKRGTSRLDSTPPSRPGR